MERTGLGGVDDSGEALAASERRMKPPPGIP